MIKKMLLFIICVFCVASSAQSKPNLILLSIGADKKAIDDNKPDVFITEADYIESHIENRCSSIYKIKKKSLRGEKATRINCLESLQWVVDNSKKNDLTIIYIGTHGRGDINGNYIFLSSTKTITSQELITELKKIKSTLLLIVDTCHSGAMIIDWKDHKENIIILTSTTSTQSAYSWRFVVPFVNALNTDLNNDRIIDISEVNATMQNHLDSKQTFSSHGTSKLPIALKKR